VLDIQKKLSSSFYTLLSLPATAMGFALSVQIAVLSWLLSTKYGLDIHEVGWVWLAGPLAGIIGQLTVGFISDKVWFWNGRRRPFILIGGIIAGLMLFLLPRLDVVADLFSTSNILIVALIVALVLDLAINVSFNPTRSIIADVTPEGDARTKGYTWMQTISGFFGVLAYFLGAFISNNFLIYFGIVLVLLFSIIPIFFIEEPKELIDDNANDDNNLQAFEVDKGQLWRIYIAHGFTWIGVQTMFVFIFAYIQQKFNLANDDAVGATIGYAFLVMNAVGFLLPKFVLEPLANKLGRVKVHLTCIAIMAAAYFGIILFGKSPAMLYILMLFVGVGWAATVSLPFAIFSDKVSGKKMGWYMGVFNLSVVIPQIIVSGLIGLWISAAADKNLIFIICAVSLAISAFLWLFVKDEVE